VAEQAAATSGGTTAASVSARPQAAAQGQSAARPQTTPRPATPTGGAATANPAATRERGAPAAAAAWRDRTEGVRRLVADTRAELRRVNWPDQETTRALTIVVIAISAALGILLGGIDFVLFQLFEAF